MKTETITCTKCGNTFFWETSRGGKPKYCLSHGRRKVVLQPPGRAWDVQAASANLEQLVRLTHQLNVEASSDRELSENDITYMLHAAVLLNRTLSEALTLIVRHGRSHGASWAQVARASDIGPWLAKKRWSASCPGPARTKAPPTAHPDPATPVDGALPGAESAAAAPQAPYNPQVSAAHKALLDELNQYWERSGLSLQDLSTASKVPAQVVTDAMTGHGKVPTQSIAGKLYTACGGDPDHLEPLWTAIKGSPPLFPSRILPPQ